MWDQDVKKARGDKSRVDIIDFSLALLRAVLECGYYSREGLIWGNMVSALKSWRNSSFLSGGKYGIWNLSSNSNPNFLCKIWVIRKCLSTLTSVEPKHKLLKAAKLCCSYWPRG